MKNKNPIIRIVVLVLAILLLTNINEAKESGTSHSISFGGDVNGNYYFADFKQFEGIENCCTAFGNTFGIGYNIHAGYEYAFPDELFGMLWQLDLSFAWSELSAPFSKTNSFANIIIGNDYVKGVAEYVIEPSVQAMIFDPGICFEPFGDLPLSLRAGFQVGFLSDMTYYQEERLIEPQNVYYENGERVRGQFSGNIPNAESQYFALSLGARYRATNFGNFALFPSLRFNYGLTNLVNGIDWKVSTLQAGISLVYNFPKAEYPKPAPPPMPPLPVPAEPLPPAQLDIFVNIELNGKNAKEFDIPFTVYESKSEYYLLPYIFFKENSDLIYTEKSQSSQNISEATAQSNVLKAAALILKEHPDYSVTLLSNSLDSESDEIVNNRITKISNELISYGIDISHIKISKHKVKVKQEEIPELKAEQIYIKLNIPEYQDLIPYTLTYSVKMEFSGRNILHIIPDIKTSVKLKAFEGKMYRNKNIIKRFDENGAEININTEAPFVIEDELRPIEFTVDLFAKNEGGAKTTLTEKIKLIPQEERRYVEKNIINKNNKTYSRYILCYFDFDGTNSVIVNKDVLTIIEQAIAEDKEIKLIPLSDNIGTAEYNKELVEKRARAAMRLLSGFDGKFNTEYFDGFLFPNDTPTGRMLNRTVIVMIAD